jgi:hypothetical protein
MARWHLAVLATALFFCILIVTAPARLLGYVLPAELLSMQGVEGSVWQGTAGSAALAVTGGHLQLGQLRWKLSPWSLLWLSPRVQLDTSWGQQMLRADISVSVAGTITLRDASITIPADLVRQWLPVELRGRLNLTTEEISMRDRQPLSGNGRLVWQNARWIGNSTSQDLGDYVLEFEVDEAGELLGTITTLGGPVQVEGKVGLGGGGYDIDIQLSSETGISAEMGSALQLVAEPRGSGYRIKLGGAF